MYENLINRLKFYIQQKETTMQTSIGRMVAPAMKREVDTLRSAVEAIEALVAGQETLKKDNTHQVIKFINHLKRNSKNKSEVFFPDGKPVTGFGIYEITDQNFADCFNLFFKEVPRE